MIFLDNSRLSHNIYNSNWTDNYGNYGTSYCLTSIKYNDKKIIIELDSYCRFKDQEGSIFTQYNTRSGDELSAGSGKASTGRAASVRSDPLVQPAVQRVEND